MLLKWVVDECRFTFVVVPDAFIIHQRHRQSRSLSMFDRNKLYNKCLSISKQDFQQYLTRRYGTRALKYIFALEKPLWKLMMTHQMEYTKSHVV